MFFDYVNVPRLSSANGGGGGGGTLLDGGGGGRIPGESATLLGYNMCECGFEGISLKVAKRSCNQDSSTGKALLDHRCAWGPDPV